MTRLRRHLQLSSDSRVRQRLRMCEMFIDHGGFSQQSLAIRTLKHHMQYILPVSKSEDGGDIKNLRYCMINGVNGEMPADI
ncbi:protein ABIL3 [Eucalyptus grandis]|uniref:protein ABIL3 n=1 Tax=Eucalyptus grandis TaxID=71139 RepID=UPI00192EAA31|nr:protein ABIL3 [Eucalyptus grandis]